LVYVIDRDLDRRVAEQSVRIGRPDRYRVRFVRADYRGRLEIDLGRIGNEERPRGRIDAEAAVRIVGLDRVSEGRVVRIVIEGGEGPADRSVAERIGRFVDVGLTGVRQVVRRLVVGELLQVDLELGATE